MAKPIKVIKSIRPATDDTTEEAPEVVEQAEEVVAEAEEATPAPAQVTITAASVAPVAPKTPDKIRISVFTEIDPAPRIGHFSFAQDMNITVLKPGVYEVPYNVGMVLIDKKVAQLV